MVYEKEHQKKAKIAVGSQIAGYKEGATSFMHFFHPIYFASQDKMRYAMAHSGVIVNFNSHINKQMPFQVIKSLPLLLSTAENEIIVLTVL